ncbi:HAD family phosphatase [Ascidiimonas aurantiaca]|uniref:HAD family hydrolase n=1 Tax=Ascidiimonas aurantiaca TaxID=1685432 RepID=UPI0030EEB540
MIKNIIFDFGDIFINLDKEATLRKIGQLGLRELDDNMIRMNESYEKGLVTTTDFVQYYHHLLPHTSKEQLIQAWNAIILDFPEYRLQFAERLAKKGNYRMFLLSNTNELHITEVKKSMTGVRYDRFKQCFEKFYLSHEIHLRKPDTEIYKYVLSENNLQSEETLFIDDMESNVLAAKNAGIQSWHLIPGKDDVTQLFEQSFFM